MITLLMMASQAASTHCGDCLVVAMSGSFQRHHDIVVAGYSVHYN